MYDDTTACKSGPPTWLSHRHDWFHHVRGWGMTASERHREFMIVGFSGFALFGGSIIYMQFSGRCVHCQRPVGHLSQSGTPFAISSDLQFCPYCGKSLDDDVTI